MVRSYLVSLSPISGGIPPRQTIGRVVGVRNRDENAVILAFVGHAVGGVVGEARPAASLVVGAAR
jgi:hypothetical protein